jgi:3-hydroxyisobutyrate dehydrogenase
MIAACEAFSLAERRGLPAQTLFDITAKSSGQCWALTSYCPVPGPVPLSPANRDYAPGFTAAMMLKDLRLAQQAAGATAAPTSARRCGRKSLPDVCRRRGRRSRFLRYLSLIPQAPR